MTIAAPGPVERVVATWYRIGDTVTDDPRRVKVATMAAKLTGGDSRAVALHISVVAVPGRDPRAAIERFVAASGSADRLIATIVDAH